MQLIKTIFFSVLVLQANLILAQSEQDSSKIRIDNIEVSFISSYYTQDGNHSPVTGGIGTEKLTNIAPSVIIKYPIDSLRAVNFDGGVDFYSSASSDNINNPYNDPNHVSGASAKDARAYFNIGYKKKSNKKHTSHSTSFGLSSEFDVLSLSVGGGISKATKNENHEISLKAKYYFDNWKLIYPVELRNGTNVILPTNQRHSLNVSITGSSVLNKKMVTSLTTDLILQSGILSTPFHRVYFENTNKAVVEILPSTRVKIPIGFRFNYFLNDFMIVRSFYRFYLDSWGMIGHTVKLELPLKINQAIKVYPFYRYHYQSGIRYFNPYGETKSTATFYTSDFDLSGLTSHKFGLGLTISPLFGISRMKGLINKERITMFKSIDLRYANYQRSDGLKANIFTIGLNFSAPNWMKLK